MFAKVEARFPDAPMVWLKDLVSYLNIKLDMASEDLLFTGKPVAYPSCLLPPKTYKQIVKIFQHCSSQARHNFFTFCLDIVVQDILKNIHTFGSRIVLQIFAQEFPSVVLDSLSKCTDLYNSNQNRHILQAIMWIVGQAGRKSLDAAYRVWTLFMLPLIGSKVSSTYIIDYLEQILNATDFSTLKKSHISVKDFFYLFDFIHSPDLAKNQRNRLLHHYSRLKLLSYGPEPTTVLRNYFPSYLLRLDPQSSDALKQEVLKSLAHCLEADIHSYSIWRQLYTKHLVQSKLLIDYLNSNWEDLRDKFPKKYLRDTLCAFQVTNEDLVNQGKAKSEVKQCNSASNKLLLKMSAPSFSWTKVLLVMLIVLGSLFIFDAAKHGSFQKSVTGCFMKDTGLLLVCQQAGKKISFYYDKTYRLLEKNVPVCTTWAQKEVGPYFELFWKKLLEGCIFLWNSTQPIKGWATENVQPLLHVLNSKFSIFAESFMLFANKFVAIAHYGTPAIHWLHSNVFTESWSIENIQKVAGNAVEIIQIQVLSLQNYVSNHLFNFAETKK